MYRPSCNCDSPKVYATVFDYEFCKKQRDYPPLLQTDPLVAALLRVPVGEIEVNNIAKKLVNSGLELFLRAKKLFREM